MSESENDSRWEALSALVDGEVDARDAAAVSSRWRDDPELRARWHSYQLIGDVLRSDELGGRGRDAAFLQRLRSRLEGEPVVLAPATTILPSQVEPARAGVLRRWATPAAVAAGFVMVAGALTVTRLPSPQPVPQLAQAPAASVPVAVAEAPKLETVEMANGMLIRDARLSQYFSAHRQFGGSSALGAPSGFLRSATYEGPAPSANSR